MKTIDDYIADIREEKDRIGSMLDERSLPTHTCIQYVEDYKECEKLERVFVAYRDGRLKITKEGYLLRIGMAA